MRLLDLPAAPARVAATRGAGKESAAGAASAKSDGGVPDFAQALQAAHRPAEPAPAAESGRASPVNATAKKAGRSTIKKKERGTSDRDVDSSADVPEEAPAAEAPHAEEPAPEAAEAEIDADPCEEKDAAPDIDVATAEAAVVAGKRVEAPLPPAAGQTAGAAPADPSPVKSRPGFDPFNGLVESKHKQYIAQHGMEFKARGAEDVPPAEEEEAGETMAETDQNGGGPVPAKAMPRPHVPPPRVVESGRAVQEASPAQRHGTTGPSPVNPPAGETLPPAAAAVDAGVARAEPMVRPVPAREAEHSPDPALVPGASAHAAPAATDAGRGAESAHAAQESPAADADQTFDQVVLGLRSKLDARTGKAEIHLEPPNLGAVRVSVSLENGTLTAQFHSSSELVRSLLKDNMEKLKTVLEGQGVAVDKLAVEAPAADSAASGKGQPQSSFGSPTHDGRSAGQYQPDARSGQRRPGEGAAGSAFARAFRQAADAPVDVVA